MVDFGNSRVWKLKGENTEVRLGIWHSSYKFHFIKIEFGTIYINFFKKSSNLKLAE